jgi:hypothetical protein
MNNEERLRVHALTRVAVTSARQRSFRPARAAMSIR